MWKAIEHSQQQTQSLYWTFDTWQKNVLKIRLAMLKRYYMRTRFSCNRDKKFRRYQRGNQKPWLQEKNKQWSTKYYTENYSLSNTNLTTGLNTGTMEGWAIPAPLVTSIVLLLLQTRWWGKDKIGHVKTVLKFLSKIFISST